MGAYASKEAHRFNHHNVQVPEIWKGQRQNSAPNYRAFLHTLKSVEPHQLWTIPSHLGPNVNISGFARPWDDRFHRLKSPTLQISQYGSSIRRHRAILMLQKELYFSVSICAFQSKGETNSAGINQTQQIAPHFL